MMRIGNSFVLLCVRKRRGTGQSDKKYRAHRNAAMKIIATCEFPKFRAQPVLRENPYLPRTLPEEIALKPANSCIQVF